MLKCTNCGLKNVDKLLQEIKYCSKVCQRSKADCIEQNHSVNIKEFSRVTYTYKGEEKKKIALVDKAAPLSSLKEEFEMKLNGFPLHRFNVYHTKEQIENLLENLKPNEIVKFQDFSQNYTCLLPEEIMSIHWGATDSYTLPCCSGQKS